jgi:hypothetical protein
VPSLQVVLCIARIMVATGTASELLSVPHNTFVKIDRNCFCD